MVELACLNNHGRIQSTVIDSRPAWALSGKARVPRLLAAAISLGCRHPLGVGSMWFQIMRTPPVCLTMKFWWYSSAR